MNRLVIFSLLPCVWGSLALSSAYAEEPPIRYFSDPPYQALGDQHEHPMSDLQKLADDGDARAQFILGDLYAKGKGGYKKDAEQAAQWFERSARQGNAHSLIRLAALAKNTGHPVEAYMWYTLALQEFGYGDMQDYLVRARADLVNNKKLDSKHKSMARDMLKKWKKGEDLKSENAAQKVSKVEPAAGIPTITYNEAFGPAVPDVLLPEAQFYSIEKNEVSHEQN